MYMGTRRTYRLRFTDGSRLTIYQYLGRVDDLVAIIGHQTSERSLPRALAELRGSGQVEFGPVRAAADGLKTSWIFGELAFLEGKRDWAGLRS